MCECDGSPFVFAQLRGILEQDALSYRQLGLDVPVVPDGLCACSLQRLVIQQFNDLRQLISSRRLTSNKGYPPGHWYMVTITQKDTESKEDILDRHRLVKEYFDYSKIEVFHAALEQSNIFHIHYVCRFPNLKKNEERDLQRITKRRVKVEKKVNSLKAFNGLCKYVTKRDYDAEKADTQIEALVSRITYEEGKGYTLTD